MKKAVSTMTIVLEWEKIINELLAKALQCKNANNMAQSEQYYLQALKMYPDHKDVLCYVAIARFEKGDYEKALELFIKCYRHPLQDEAAKEDILNQILCAYYQPNEETFKKNYEKNIQQFLSYEHNYIKSFIEFEELPFICIPQSDVVYYIFEKNTKQFTEAIVLNDIMKPYPDIDMNYCVLGVNVFDPLQLQSLENQTIDPTWVNNRKVPIYLLWSHHEHMQQYFQIVDYAPALATNRLVIFPDFAGQSELKTFLADHQVYLPNRIVGDMGYAHQIKELIEEVEATRQEDYERNQKAANELALQYDKEYYKKLFSGSMNQIRILFYTSRFTQVVQYATRDFMNSCKSIGIECELVIEKTDIHRADQNELVSKIAKFQPNVIFRINYFKDDFMVIPKNMMFITWIQDPVMQIYSSQYAQRFAWNDFSLVYCHGWYEKMIETGFDQSRLAVQINPVDEKIFETKEMTQREKEFYTADIAFPGNYQRPEKDLASMILACTENIQNDADKSTITNLLISTYEIFKSKISNNELVCQVEECESVINELAMLLEIPIPNRMVKDLASMFFQPLLCNLYRKMTLKWLIDAGFQVKLWGLGWDTDPDFKAHAAGVLKHGDELAKMYSCTKIVPGGFFWLSAHARSWESTSCGALFMARNIPSQFDFANIRDCFTEDEDCVFYNNREDLVDKVKYYLAHEDERKAIVESGRQKVLDKMTYSSTVSKCLQLIKDNMTK